MRDYPPIHPGEILLEEFLKPMHLSQYRLAKEIHVPPRRINEIVKGKRTITADTALRLSRFFGTSEGSGLAFNRILNWKRPAKPFGQRWNELNLYLPKTGKTLSPCIGGRIRPKSLRTFVRSFFESRTTGPLSSLTNMTRCQDGSRPEFST